MPNFATLSQVLRGFTSTLMIFAAGTAAAGDVDLADRTFAGSTDVVASRVADAAAEVGRREVIVTREEIADLPVQTVQDLLAVLPGLGLTRRGARGVQADLNLRGGSFEQSVVMVNGVRVNNPQTGHHNLDLFIPLEAIERVEVLFGPGSAVHGPDAFGGAVNIITGVSHRAVAQFRLGENDLAGGTVAGSWRGLWGAVEREVHTGFRDNTEADVNQAAAGWRGTAGRARMQLTAAAGRRRFGAHAFYSTRFPDQRERTAGQLLTLDLATPMGRDLELGFALRADRHTDDFWLDRNRPEWYHNHHVTRGLLADLEIAQRRSDGWRWAAGVEGAFDEIESSNLGDHDRDRQAIYVEGGRSRGDLSWAVQLRADHQDPWGWRTNGAVGGRWQMSSGLAVRASAGTSFRAPSFTELWYTSPATVGNPDLAPEEGATVEVGLEGRGWSVTAFGRRADPIIDYILGDDGVYRATNVGTVTTTGLEAEIHLPARGMLRWQRLGVTWLESDIDVDPARSTYALTHPTLEAAWTGALRHRAWRGSWAVRFRDPQDRSSWVVADVGVGRRILEEIWIDLEASNVFDRDITELHGVPLPGRWVTLTTTWRLGTP
jgi:vitamin B12 transporter